MDPARKTTGTDNISGVLSEPDLSHLPWSAFLPCRRMTAWPPGLTLIHSAPDAGTIFETQGLADLLITMPTTPDVHTPRERVGLDSFCRTYRSLKEILTRC